MAKIGKRAKAARAAFEGKSDVAVEEAVALVKANANAKFDETVEIAMNLGIDPRHADQMVRGTVNLPNGTGKSVRVAVFARGPKADEAKEAGADNVVVWGTGSPMREFLHVDDLADACVFLMDNYSAPDIVNVGWGKDISIADLAELVKRVVGFEGEIVIRPGNPTEFSSKAD